ncbi:MAG: DEAD/DEAH box helicase, partial [Hadesarchaea archaeon]|nr:DEAD/DEAH box helicase [Hadesarchaea archaeon]
MDEFKKLHTRVKQTLSELDFKKPTPAQELAIPPILEGDNTLLIAPTGTGKTEAALLPVFTQLLENKEENDDNSDNNGINVLYIAPLRALNRDMRSRLGDWQEKLDLDIQVRHGDTSQYQRRKQALDPPDMLITTPETLQAILPGKRLKEHLKSVKWVIIDEVHELAESKRGTQLSIGLERLSRLTDDFQRIGLSATLGNPAEISRFLVGAKRDVRIMDASTSEEISLQIESPMPSEEDAELEDKLNAQPTLISRLRRMRDLINEHESTLVFTNTREAAESLGSRLRFWDSEAPIKVHHGSLSRETRISAEEKFRNTDLKSLICTSSMELGIDIGAIDFVVQY